MDTHIAGSVLAVLAAYQNNLVTSKMMTSGVVQWFPAGHKCSAELDKDLATPTVPFKSAAEIHRYLELKEKKNRNYKQSVLVTTNTLASLSEKDP